MRDVIKLIEQDGWRFERQRGSHRIYRHPTKPGTVTVAGHRRTGRASGYTGEHLVASKNEGTATVSEYVVIYEQGPTGWGAYCPDLPGLGVAAASRDEAERLIREGVQLHIDSLREHGEPVPAPTSAAGVVAVAAV